MGVGEGDGHWTGLLSMLCRREDMSGSQVMNGGEPVIICAISIWFWRETGLPAGIAFPVLCTLL